MSKKLSLFIYNLFWPFALLFMLPGALVKMRKRGGRWQDLAHRIGAFPATKQHAIDQLPNGPRRIWIHAVSVGEVGIATKLMARLLKDAPDLGLVLTTTTPTGYALAEDFAARHPGHVVALYSPLDLPPVARRFLDVIVPAQIVLVEAEVWPNLVSIAQRRHIPVSLVNARLSPRSERRYQKFGWLVKPIFSMLHQVLVQEPGDVQRWTSLGLSADRIHHTGSIKFDPQGGQALPEQVESLRTVLNSAGITPDKPILLAASTHAGEEVLLAKVYQQLLQRFPDLAFLIVPRHVERTPDILAELHEIGLQPQPQRRSAITAPSDCLIIDTTGELRAWQSLATIVVVGKSFLATGGQNPAEAVMAKKPVLFGPHMENFEALINLLLTHKGAIQVADTTELQGTLTTLLADPSARDSLGAAGHAALQIHEGATERTASNLLALLQP